MFTVCIIELDDYFGFDRPRPENAAAVRHEWFNVLSSVTVFHFYAQKQGERKKNAKRKIRKQKLRFN